MYLCSFDKFKSMNDDNLDSDVIFKAAKAIRDGELVAFPTETVYGLGANALDAEAVAKIFIEKERPSFDPLIVHISNIEDIKLLTLSIDNRIYKIAETFWPGPLTMVLPKSTIVPDIVTSGLPTVGIRMPNNKIALSLISASQRPIAAPSANKFGKISPTKAEHVKKQLKGVKHILDGGSTKIGIESTVITLKDDGFLILREGYITAEDLIKVIPQSKESITNNILESPGLLKSHYSPDKPIYIESQLTKEQKEILNNQPKENKAYISFSGKTPDKYGIIEFLSKKSDLKEAASNLFSILHKLEECETVKYIVTESVPEEGIGIAIMDRLRKASYQYKK